MTTLTHISSREKENSTRNNVFWLKMTGITSNMLAFDIFCQCAKKEKMCGKFRIQHTAQVKSNLLYYLYLVYKNLFVYLKMNM